MAQRLIFPGRLPRSDGKGRQSQRPRRPMRRSAVGTPCRSYAPFRA